jgi:hypothetical protein
MPSTSRAIAIALGALLLGGCATTSQGYRLVAPPRETIGDVYTVAPQISWTGYTTEKVDSWTVDGFALESLRFFKGIAAGEPLLTGGKDEERRPRFRATMAESEIAEFVVDSLYSGRAKPRELRPAPFGAASGFRFDLSYATTEGVNRRALVIGAVVQDKLQLIVYDGTTLHYFPRHQDEVERLIQSIQLRSL